MTRVRGAPVGRTMEMDGDLGFLCHFIKYHMSLLSHFSWALGFSICYQSGPEGVLEALKCKFLAYYENGAKVCPWLSW